MLPFLLLFQRFVTNLELFIFCFLYTIIFVYFGKNTFILMQIVSLIKAYIYLVVDLFIDVEFIFFSLNIWSILFKWNQVLHLVVLTDVWEITLYKIYFKFTKYWETIYDCIRCFIFIDFKLLFISSNSEKKINICSINSSII